MLGSLEGAGLLAGVFGVPPVGVAPDDAARGVAPPEAVAAVLPLGNICEVIEPGPKRWTTIPEGGGVGSWRASAGSAQRDASIAVDRSLNFKDFLRREGRAP